MLAVVNVALSDRAHLETQRINGPDPTVDDDVPNNRAFGELRRHVVKHGSTVLMDITYDASGERRRDDLGRIRVKTETFRGLSPTTPTTNVVEYEYDERNRLENVYVNSDVPTQTFGYDLNGNRTSYSTPTSSKVGAYDPQDRLTTY